MSVFQRIKLIVSSNINHMISKAEEPDKILEQLIIDMREQLQEAKKEVAVSLADEKRLERQLADEQKKAKEWEKKAMLAVRSGRDDLARQALGRKAEHDALVAGYQEQYDAQHTAVQNLRGALHQLHDKIEEARRKKNMLIAREKRAKAQKKIHDTMSGLSDTSAFDAFDRMTGKIDQIEAEAAASAELSGELGYGADGLEEKFADLQASAGQEDELAALKAKMGLGGEPAAPAPTPAGDVDEELAALKAKYGD